MQALVALPTPTPAPEPATASPLTIHVTGLVAENANLQRLTQAAQKLNVPIESVDELKHVTEQRLALRRLRLDFNTTVDTYLAPYKNTIKEAEKVKTDFVNPTKALEDQLEARVTEFKARQANQHAALLKTEQGQFADRDALLKANGFAYQPDENVYKKGRHKIPVYWLRSESEDWLKKVAKFGLEDIAPQQAQATTSYFDEHRSDVATLKRFWSTMPTTPDPATMQTEEGRAMAQGLQTHWEAMKQLLSSLYA